MTREDIKFDSGASNDMGRGYGNGNPKISIQIKGVQPRWKALYRGDCHLGAILQNKVTEFLESDEVKDYLINYFIADEEYNKKANELKKKERELRERYKAEIAGDEPKYNYDRESEDYSEEYKIYQAWVDKFNIAVKKACMEVYGMEDDYEALDILRKEIFEKHNVK